MVTFRSDGTASGTWFRLFRCGRTRPRFEGFPPIWFAYLAVDGVHAVVEKAKPAGAELMRSIFDVPGVGRIAILQDPSGAGLGWMTPAQA